jgi:hypothetical protein
MRTVPLTTLPGAESQPAFSSDGEEVAFVWDGGIGIVSSLIAAVVYAVVALLVTVRVRKRRAKTFTGKYRMLESDGSRPTSGTVTIERKGWVENLLSPSPVLTVFAEHGSGHAPGTEDWRGTVEIVGLSNIAGGYFFYRNRAGGALRLQLSDDGKEITEYGTPFDPTSRPFIKVLQREP